MEGQRRRVFLSIENPARLRLKSRSMEIETTLSLELTVQICVFLALEDIYTY